MGLTRRTFLTGTRALSEGKHALVAGKWTLFNSDLLADDMTLPEESQYGSDMQV